MTRTRENVIKTGERSWKVIFFVYILILIKLIIFKYPWQTLVAIAGDWEKGIILKGISGANFTLGKSIRMYIRYFDKFPFWNGFANLIGNVLVFIPYGYLLPKSYSRCGRWWRTIYCAVGFVMSIELVQLATGFGIFDIDDVVLNVSGAMLGYGIFALFRSVKIRFKIRKKIKESKK